MLDPRDNHMLRSVRERILADPSGDYDDALFHSFLASAGLGKEIFNHHHYIEDNGKRYIAASLSESGKGAWLSLRTFLYSFSSNYVEYDGFVLDGIIIEKDFIDTLPVFQSAKKEDILSSFSEFVELIKNNVNIVRAVRNSGIAPTFGSVLVSRVMERYKLIFHANDKCLEEAAYIFCINGIQGIINNWIDKGCIESIDTIASISIRLAFNTVGLSSDISV